MEWTYFWILLTSLSATLAAVLFKPEKIYEYPYFMAAVFLVFIVPQAISLIRFPGAASGEQIEDVLLMCCLCFGMCWAGYQRRPSRALQQRLTQPVNLDRLFLGGLAFIAISFFFNFLILQMTPEETGGSMWTGKVTIYGFFEDLIYPGFAIALSTALRTNRPFAWLAAVVGAIIPLQAAIFSGRREDTVQFLLTLAFTLYYQRKIKPSRLVIVFCIVFAMLAIPATGTYRSIAQERDWGQIDQIDLVGNFESYLNSESVLELRNAAMVIGATQFSGRYEYGEAYWDQLVFRFVPAQLLGQGFKDSLMFETSDERAQSELARVGYDIPVGSTITGMADSFQQFSWFGCLFFAAVGFLFKSLFRATLQPNATFAQLFYILIATSAMRAVTHQTLDFLPGLLYYLIFMGLLFLYARVPMPRAKKRRSKPETNAVKAEMLKTESGNQQAKTEI